MSASPQIWIRPLRSLLIAAAAAAALVACGSDDDSTTTAAAPAATLSGIAAVGSPIVGGTVNVSCASGAGLSTSTNSGGAWQVTINSQTLPCAVQVNGGTVGGVANTLSLHSVAFDFSNLNVTPLTELVVARAVAGNPQAWFNAPAFAALTAANVNAAVTQIVNALGIASALVERNPMVAAFQPQAGDPIDDLLTALSAALQTLGTDFAALLAAAGTNNFVDFPGLANAIATAQAGGGGSTGGSCATGVEMTFARGQAAGPFADAQKVCVEASSTSLKIGSLTLGNPTPNTIVTAPFSAYTFVDAGLYYEVVFNNGALYEINVGKVNAISAADFHGQLTPTAASGGATLTVEVAISGVTSASFTVPNQTPPASQAEFCADPASNPNLLGLQAQNGISLTITGCSFANNVGTIQATATASGISVPYVVRFTYGS
ncbi:MAG: hypothetical protein ACRC2B_24970 [Rubrivivax sp.]